MISIATLGPKGSHAWQAARGYNPDADIRLYPNIGAVIEACKRHEAEFAVIPVYNTREGEIKEYFRLMEKLTGSYWINNVILSIRLSLGAIDAGHELSSIVSKSQALRQCEEYISANYPDVSILTTHDLDESIATIKSARQKECGVIATEEILKNNGLTIRAREVAPYNRTRFAVLGPAMPPATGYDATAIITEPLKDRVGLLFDILGEFNKHGVNLLDLRTETDIKSQELQFYFEMEGHIHDESVKQAVDRIETQVIQEPGVIKVLGSYPRLDMRTKLIRTFGFIGTGDMSTWFVKKLENEGYRTLLTGRSSTTTPEEMIPQVEAVVVCVPISATPATVKQYGPLLKDGQALILLAGEAENTLNTALKHTREGVEVMLAHNLWGPQAATMKDKNAALVRTPRSGALCSEFESFLYKHGAVISQDTPTRHDLLMGVGQKLPSAISTAMAMTLKQNAIAPADIGSHATLTSLYGILAMARIHAQNPRTYAEILATQGDGRKIVRDFARNLLAVLDLAENGKIEELCAVMDANREYLTEEFLKDRMRQALAVDKTLGRIIRS